MSYYVTTDATCDLNKSEYRDNFAVIPMAYLLNGEEYGIDKDLSCHEFYEIMRGGAMPTTSLITTYFAKECLSPILKEGYDILHICFASALSGSYQNLLVAQQELREDFPDRKIYLIDSKCACAGEGLLVHYALKAREDGMSIDENYEYTTSLVQHIGHYFTVDDLNHLYRGGRVSKASAVMGTMLKIKPLLYSNTEGKLVPIDKVISRKKALVSLADKVAERIQKDADTIFIAHGDCPEDCDFAVAKIKEKTGVENVVISEIGPVIGSHSGPATIAVFFLTDNRIEAKDETLKKN